MKSLNSYMNDALVDMLDKQIIQHIYIHEGFNIPYVHYTFEGIGLFRGCKEIIQYFDNNYSNIFGSLKDTVIINSKDIRNDIFFDKLIIRFKQTQDNDFREEYQIGYVNDEQNDEYDLRRWNEENQKFNFIEINIYNIDIASPNDVLELLTHELSHAHDDYILRSKGISSLRNKKLTNNFTEELKKISNNIKWNRLVDFKNKSKYDDYLKYDIPEIEIILYYLENTEISSYIAQLNQTLKGHTFSTAEEAVKFLNEKSATYSNYKYLYELFNNSDYDNKLIELGFKQSTINKFKKITKNTWNKIVNHLYHILDDNGSIKENALLKINAISTKFWNR